MPFFLVSHKSLIEADNDKAAAEATLLALQDAATVTFTVTIDQGSSTRVVVEAPRRVSDTSHEAGATAEQEGASQGQTAAFSSVGAAQGRPLERGFSYTASGYTGLLFVAGLLLGVALGSS
jgi:hypothetical protein